MSPAMIHDAPGPLALRRQRVTSRATVALAVAVAAVGYRLYRTGQFRPAYWRPFVDPDIVHGLAMATVATLRAAAMGIAFALALGTVLAFGRLSTRRAVRQPTIAFIDFFRAVPVLLLLLFIYLGFSQSLGQMGSLVLALALFNGAVLAEIIAAGIRALPRGQTAQLIYTGYGNILPTVFVAGTIYVSINLAISGLATVLERRQRRTAGSQRVALRSEER